MIRIAIVLMLAAPLSQYAPAQEPAFRTSTRLVQINVIVRDKNGPVATLTKKDFILKVNQPKANSLRVSGSVDIHNVQLAESGDLRNGALDIYIFQQNVMGLVLDQVRSKLSLQFTREEYLTYLRSGVLFREYVQPKNGLAILRVVVGDPASGTVGSLIIPAAQVK